MENSKICPVGQEKTNYIHIDSQTINQTPIESPKDTFEVDSYQKQSFAAQCEEVIDKVLSLRNKPLIKDQDLINCPPITTHNALELLVNGSEAYKAIFEAVDNAKTSIHINYFQFYNDRVGNLYADKLIAKARQGVKVRVMLDRVGSNKNIQALVEKLKKGHVEVICNNGLRPRVTSPETWLTPMDHRKIVVIDGKVGFTGGINVADEYVTDYHDVMVKIQGECVSHLQIEWMQRWIQGGGRIDETDSNETLKHRYFPISENEYEGTKIGVLQHLPGKNDEIKQGFLLLIANAKNSIDIQVPYMTDKHIFDALIQASGRGVKVRILLPRDNDSKLCHWIHESWFQTLIQKGIEVYLHKGFNHGKVMLVDNEQVMIGSSNLDGLSLRRMHELNLFVDDHKFAQNVKERLFDIDFPDAIRIEKNSKITFTNSVKSIFALLMGSFA